MNDRLYQDTKLITSDDIGKLVNMEDAIDAMERAFASFSDGTSCVPQRHITGINDLDLFYKPAYNKELGRIAVKIITQKKSGISPGRPAIKGLVLLLDMETGAIIAMMDGGYFTALRTGAAGGVAAKLLAVKNAETLAIIGCGTQGRSLVESACSVRPIKRALFYDLVPDAAHKLKSEMEGKLNISIRVMKDPEYLKEADIICTATGSKHPLFSKKDISKGVHINAIGSYKPSMQEIDPEILRCSRLFVDSRESVLKESGDLVKPISEQLFTDAVIEAEIGELISNIATGRIDNNEITIFKSVGLAVQDLFLASMIYDKYLQQ